MASHAHEARTTAAAATTVMSNSVTPYMTVDLRVGDGRLRVEWTEATLGVIPIPAGVLVVAVLQAGETIQQSQDPNSSARASSTRMRSRSLAASS